MTTDNQTADLPDVYEAFEFLKKQTTYEEEFNPNDKSTSCYLAKWKESFEALRAEPNATDKYKAALAGKRMFVNRAKLGKCFLDKVHLITLSIIKLHFGIEPEDWKDAARRIVNTGWSATQWEMEIYNAIQGDIWTPSLVEMKESFEESGLMRTRLYKAILEELEDRGYEKK